jgi:hypothetical protein
MADLDPFEAQLSSFESESVTICVAMPIPAGRKR